MFPSTNTRSYTVKTKMKLFSDDIMRLTDITMYRGSTGRAKAGFSDEIAELQGMTRFLCSHLLVVGESATTTSSTWQLVDTVAAAKRRNSPGSTRGVYMRPRCFW